MKLARIGITAPFMVIETETLSSGISANSVSMSYSESIATPTCPTSAIAIGSSES